MKDKRKADRIKAVYLLGAGWSVEAVHQVLFLDKDTISNYYAWYQDRGLMGLLDDKYVGNKGLLGDKEIEALEAHLEEVVYRTAKEVVKYIKQEFDEDYSVSGVHELLKRLGFV